MPPQGPAAGHYVDGRHIGAPDHQMRYSDTGEADSSLSPLQLNPWRLLANLGDRLKINLGHGSLHPRPDNPRVGLYRQLGIGLPIELRNEPSRAESRVPTELCARAVSVQVDELDRSPVRSLKKNDPIGAHAG